MASGSHDTLVQRLAMMLVKLNQGENLDPRALAQEFGVNVITALQAIIWEGMRLAGVNDKVANYGKLFREH